MSTPTIPTNIPAPQTKSSGKFEINTTDISMPIVRPAPRVQPLPSPTITPGYEATDMDAVLMRKTQHGQATRIGKRHSPEELEYVVDVQKNHACTIAKEELQVTQGTRIILRKTVGDILFRAGIVTPVNVIDPEETRRLFEKY